jgi:uncharacterized protein with FMN-binding domain
LEVVPHPAFGYHAAMSLSLPRIWICLLATFALVRGDTLEFKNGAKLAGDITQINETAKTVTINLTLRGRTYARTYRFSDLRVIEQGGQRRDLEATAPGAPVAAAASTTGSTRSEQEVIALIESEGASDPAWLATTKLNHPPTLDLNWPKPPPKPWNSQKNVGQFIWDVVNPNTGRWREGIKLMYSLRDRHRNNPAVLEQVHNSLGSMYYRFFQDYARAAYWWRTAGADLNGHGDSHLADCYFRLGSKELALKQMAGKPLRPATIKLLGAMGETDKAVKVAEAFAKSSSQPHDAFLAAGDSLALAGRFPEALKYYDKVLTDPRSARNKEYERRFKSRARESIESIKLFELLDVGKVADGRYQGSATGYNGALDVEVSVQSGRVAGVRVTRHREKQYYSALTDVPAQIVAKQSVKDIDATSGATITAQAIVNATAKALARGK